MAWIESSCRPPAICSFEPISPVAILLATATLGLIVARTALAFRDNRALLEARERDALTDGLTGLGNRRRLMVDLESTLSETGSDSPRSLVIFDLDGFKGYNDAFGHPTGDALLARLGANLGGAVSPHGSAYRIGGDEFCALVSADAVKTEVIVAGRLRGALRARRAGCEVGSPSWGMAGPRQRGEHGRSRHSSSPISGCTRRNTHARTWSPRDARAVLLRSPAPSAEPGLDAQSARRRRRCWPEEVVDLTPRAGQTRTPRSCSRGRPSCTTSARWRPPTRSSTSPGRWTEQEAEIMRRHTVIGERILESVPALRPVASIVRSTHERLGWHRLSGWARR